jgi:hypothetical protein
VSGRGDTITISLFLEKPIWHDVCGLNLGGVVTLFILKNIHVKDKEGKITSVLVGQIDLDPVWEIRRNVPVGETGRVDIVDRHGIVVAAPDPGLVLDPIKYDAIRTAAANMESTYREK